MSYNASTMGIVPCIRSCVFLHTISFKLYSPHIGLDWIERKRAQLLNATRPTT